MDRRDVLISISRIHFPVLTLGPGRRIGIWFQGCSIRCTGCVSADTWERERPMTSVAAVSSLVVGARDRGATGVTISGGEPFDQPEGLLALLRELRTAASELDVLVYSGYTLDVLRRKQEESLLLLDAVISGPFIAGRPTTLPWRGSENQVLTTSERVRERYAAPPSAMRLQVSVEGGSLWLTGIPERDDLERFESLMGAEGVVLREVSWRT